MLFSLFSYLEYIWWLGDVTNFWCLMFTVLAIAVGISYFVLGWSATSLSFVSLIVCGPGLTMSSPRVPI
jgi:ATP-binding cassette, subfamily B (MDR/TAP), member 1